MKRKIILGLGAVAIVIAGVASFSAWEAHIINVTAHIENALSVETKSLDFGTVFPQEYLEKDFTIYLSESFLAEGNADGVNYVINQKTKCKLDPEYTGETLPPYAAVNYWDDACPQYYLPMESLCPYLSKIPVPEEGEYNDTGVPSYFISYEDGCIPFGEHEQLQAIGKLAKSQNDEADTWIVDLKVPPFAGYVGQDWPAGCPVLVDADPTGTDMGCDLWIEITGISRAPESGPENTVLSLENKHGEGWFITVDDIYGVLEFVPCGETFDFNLTAAGLPVNTDYSLIYYADPWPGNNPGALIWEGPTDASGAISVIGGSQNIGTDIPNSSDANYPDDGGKIWLIPSSAYNSGTRSVTAWPYDQSWLFEYNLIQYNQVCPQ